MKRNGTKTKKSAITVTRLKGKKKKSYPTQILISVHLRETEEHGGTTVEDGLPFSDYNKAKCSARSKR